MGVTRPMGQNVARVGIAVVERDASYLVGTRRPDEALAGCAEFPGGKCLLDELPSACAVRECFEETGLSVAPVRRLYACRHAYPHAVVDLEFWLCRPITAVSAAPAEGDLSNRGYRWLPAEALKSLPFPEANRPLIELLAVGGQPAG
jgi:8-oxo-dGTP diphosphatase